MVLFLPLPTWLKEPNVLLLTKKATEKDRSLKRQFLLSANSQPVEKNQWRSNLEKK